MPGTTTPGHVTITVSGSKTKLAVDPTTYSEVDITDFAPRAVAGTPTFSTLGLYLDVAQDGFGHGFGQYEFSEPKSYAWSGHQVDTRHNHISLWTNYSTLINGTSSLYINKMAWYGSTPVLALNNAIGVLRPSDGALATFNWSSAEVRDILYNGKYFYFSSSAQLRLGWIGTPTAVDATTAQFSVTFESSDQFTDGKVWVIDGTGAGNSTTITATNTTGLVTVSSWVGTAPDTSSLCMLIHYCGSAGNPPNNFSKMAIFGGSMWAIQNGSHYVHFWSETNGLDAEGGGTTDAGVVIVGPPGQGLLNLAAFQNQLYIARPDGLWVVNEQDSDAVAYHTLPYDTETWSQNFASMLVWQGFLVYAVRNNLYKYKSGTQDISPPTFDEYPPYKKFGGLKGLFARGKFMYVMGQSNEAFSDETLETTTGFVSFMAHDGVGWHKLMDMPISSPTKYDAWFNPSNSIAYLFEYAGSKGYLYTVQMQAFTDIPYASYPTGGGQKLYTSYYDLGMKRISKSFGSVTLHGYLTSGQTVNLYYRVDSTLTWTLLGTFNSDMEEIPWPVTVTGKRIQFKLDLNTNSAASTPIVKALILKVMLRPGVLYGVTCDVIVSDSISDQNRLSLGHTAKEIRAALKAARDSVGPITFVDIHGDSHSAYLSSVRFTTIAYEDSDAVQEVAHSTFVYI